MTSNILAGERRWASARRTGMTVLGKVAVPKPLNLPSQRLENHGLDPNVEIVPKGSLGWGGRPSSSASNPWGSSLLSPNADGGASPPSHLGGRPSSGGTGSRPSTAGSERTHERSGGAWGLGTRPSSSSGTSASTQTASLTSLRPQSAETRPGSSQLSRFAEPVSDLVARSAVGSPERMRVASSDNERFSLSTGDFPTLNSSRDSFAKNHDSRDQDSNSRPSSGSGSGRVALQKEKSETSQVDAKSETVNTWRRNPHPSADDGTQPRMEKWHGEPQQFLNANIPPPQFDAWRGPPMSAPPGAWYRGPPAGPPYGAPVAPGGFPVEPFPYYCPQIPPAALANSQPVPRPGPGPRGPPSKNGELYRPQMPDAFVRPGMPFRPGFYPTPMPFDSYYGHPMGYCNSNDREIPFKGMAAGPPVYNIYPAPNAPDIGNSHAKAGKSSSAGKILSEQGGETAHADDAPGQYKVLLKQDNGEKRQGDNQEQRHMATCVSAEPKGQQSGRLLRRNEWGADHDGEDEMHSRTMQVGNSVSRPVDELGVYNPSSATVMSSKSGDDVAVENSQIKKLDAASSSLGMPQSSSARERGLVTARDSTLMQKIEGLNEKVRSSDCRNDGLPSSQWEEHRGSFHAVSSKVGNITSQAGNDIVCDEGLLASGITGGGVDEKIVAVRDKTSLPTTAARRPYEGMHGRGDASGKQRFNSQDSDGWQKKPGAAEGLNFPSANVASASSVQGGINSTVAAMENPSEKNEGESSSEVFETSDTQAQRAKMREVARERALQLQKEEEERIREQKAKAFAKLEELNRRTQGGNATNLKGDKDLLSRVPCQEQEESQSLIESGTAGSKSQTLSTVLALEADIVNQDSESTVEWGGEVADSAGHVSVEKSKTLSLEPVVLQDNSLPPKQEMLNIGDPDYKGVPQKRETGSFRHKRNSYKPKQNAPLLTDVAENLVAIDTTKAPKDYIQLAADDTGSVAPAEVVSSGDSNMDNIPNIVSDSPPPQRRKSNRSNKNKHKLDDAPSVPAVPSSVPNESSCLEVSTENETSKSDVESGSIHAAVIGCGQSESSEQHSTFHSEEVHGRVSSHRKHQQSRRSARSQQTNRFVDKHHGNDHVMWAPVRSLNKGDFETETYLKTVQESITSEKTDNQVQSNLKSKRAEMERYVPKPVAKELAQQVSLHPLPPSGGTDEKVEPELVSSGNVQPLNSAFGNAVSTAEHREGDFKHNKQLKAHGAWRQRRSVEPMLVKGLQSGSSASTSKPGKNPQISVGPIEAVKHELISAKAERKSSRELSASDGGSNMLKGDSDIAAPVMSPHGRDHGVVAKGKRHALKSDKNMGNEHGHVKNLNSWEADRNHVHVGGPGINPTEKIPSPKDSRSIEERTSSHWQPKYHSSSNNSQRVMRTIIDQSGPGEASGFVKKDKPYQPLAHVPQRHVKGSSGVDCSQSDQSASENKTLLEVANVGHQGQKKERKGRPYSPNEISVGADELNHTVIADTQNKQQFSSDSKRNQNQNNRPTSSRESRADWNREGQKQNSHYEYQPIGPSNNSKTEKFEDGSQNPRYKERGQSHSKRRGNFPGQQGGNVRRDAGFG